MASKRTENTLSSPREVIKGFHREISNVDDEKESIERHAQIAVKKQAAEKKSVPTVVEMASDAAVKRKRDLRVSATSTASEMRTEEKNVASASYGSDKMLEVVFGDDDREPVKDVTGVPWRKIAALRITSKAGRVYIGTGWFISNQVLATAGHCVYLHDDGGWPASIQVLPALDGERQTFAPSVSKTFKSNEGWVKDRNSDFDYGVIILDAPADPRIGTFSFAAFDDDSLASNIANICGYPADLDRGTKQYHHARNITRASSRRLYYEIDTYGGQSGSPIWLTLGENGERVVVGIHTTGGTTSNFGTRITKELFQNLKNWKDNGNSKR